MLPMINVQLTSEYLTDGEIVCNVTNTLEANASVAEPQEDEEELPPPLLIRSLKL